MPSTVIYRSGWPDAARPIEAMASVASDGLVTGNARFVVPEGGSTAFPVNTEISQSFFKSLDGVLLQGPLFVDSRALEVRNGISTLSIGVLGAVNPPLLVQTTSQSTNTYSTSSTNDEGTSGFSCCYTVEISQVSYWQRLGSNFVIKPKRPRLLAVFNVEGNGGLFGDEEFEKGRINTPYPGDNVKILQTITLKSIERRGLLERVSVQNQLVVS